MPSALTGRGSTSRWRRIRLAILNRDGWRCRVPLADGGPCGRPARTAGHILARIDGGGDTWANLRAECAWHNYRGGGLLAARRPDVPDHRARGW
jgi:5-methylcytosine-specific restriction endonuclease McrA